MYAILLGTGSEGVNGATWCNSLLGRLLRGRSDTPQSGIGAQRYPFISSFLIINFVRICVGFRSYGLVRYGPSGYEPGYT